MLVYVGEVSRGFDTREEREETGEREGGRRCQQLVL